MSRQRTASTDVCTRYRRSDRMVASTLQPVCPLPRLDEIAATGFERAAGDYERGRPGSPAAAVERMRREIGIEAGQTVVDLAAGTGKLTRRLVELLPAEV